MNSETLNTIEGERSIPSVNAVNTARWKRGAVGLAFVGATAVAAGAVYVKLVNAEPAEQAPKQRNLTTASTVPVRTFTELPALPEPEPVLIPEPIQPAVPVALPAPVQRPQQPPKPPKPRIDKSASRSAVAVSSGPTQASDTQAVQNSSGGMNGAFAGDLSGSYGSDSGIMPVSSGGSDLGQSLSPTKLTGTSASLLGNRDYMLTRGAYIDCVLNTRLNSSLPGMSTCTVTRDVFSSNGRVVLVEAGSTVTGEYRANTAQGMNRIFVLWSRLQTPTGVVVDLNSPGTDSLGGSGIAGNVDNHFWQRFGGAMMLSLIDDVAQVAVNNSSNNENAQVVLGNATNTASDLASEVLRNTINIPPTIYANQGARVGIFVARDLDFSTVYKIQ